MFLGTGTGGAGGGGGSLYSGKDVFGQIGGYGGEGQYNSITGQELEYGKGKEVLDRIKKDYEYKKIGIQNELIVKKEIRLSNNVEKDFYKIVDKNNQFLYIPDLPSEFYNSEKEAYDVIKTLSSKIPYTLEEQQEDLS